MSGFLLVSTIFLLVMLGEEESARSRAWSQLHDTKRELAVLQAENKNLRALLSKLVMTASDASGGEVPLYMPVEAFDELRKLLGRE